MGLNIVDMYVSLFNVYKRFLFFVTFFTFLTFLYCFERFFTSVVLRNAVNSNASSLWLLRVQLPRAATWLRRLRNVGGLVATSYVTPSSPSRQQSPLAICPATRPSHREASARPTVRSAFVPRPVRGSDCRWQRSPVSRGPRRRTTKSSATTRRRLDRGSATRWGPSRTRAVPDSRGRVSR